MVHPGKLLHLFIAFSDGGNLFELDFTAGGSGKGHLADIFHIFEFLQAADKIFPFPIGYISTGHVVILGLKKTADLIQAQTVVLSLDRIDRYSHFPFQPSEYGNRSHAGNTRQPGFNIIFRDGLQLCQRQLVGTDRNCHDRHDSGVDFHNHRFIDLIRQITFSH